MRILQMLKALRERSRTAWGLALATVAGGAALAQATTDPTDTLKTAACNISNALGNNAIVFPILVIVVLWAGYMIYMGKREATDVIVKAVVATAIVLGARVIAGWIATGNC